jgi:hypothetical protein
MRVKTLLGLLAILIFVGVLAVIVATSIRGTQNITNTDAETIYVWHDDSRHVTCWIYALNYKGGLSCIPDSQLDQ